MKELLDFVKAVGLPGAIALFVLWRLSEQQARILETLQTVAATLSVLVGKH